MLLIFLNFKPFSNLPLNDGTLKELVYFLKKLNKMPIDLLHSELTCKFNVHFRGLAKREMINILLNA